ncbi:MAG: tetratricopeptide repeat protein [Nitrospirae bacterium]|nr:tetratricopeptide repeat protein [Nitrospirota bacterium]
MEKSKIIENAQQYALRGQLSKAIEEWKKLLADTPNDAGIYNTIGDLHLRNQASQEAVEAYLQAGEIFHSSGFTAKAIAVFQKILKIAPERKDIYLRIGEMNVERGMVGNARESFLKVARLYTQEGMIRESLEVFRKIADLDPTNLSVRLKIAEACLKEGLKGEAIEEYLKIAEAHLKRDQTPEAEGLYRQILGFDPGNRKALLEIGRCHLTGDHPEAAVGYAEKILEDHPDSVEALSLLLETYLRMDGIEKAEETVRRLIALDPDHLPYQEKMAEIALRRGDFSLAAATLIPVGSAYLQRGEYTRAVESFRPLFQRGGEEVLPVEAVDVLFHASEGLGQTDRIVLWGLQLGRLYQEVGDPEKALRVYEQVLKWSPSQEEALAESRRIAPSMEVVTSIPPVEEAFHEISLAGREGVMELPSAESVSPGVPSSGGILPEEDPISEHLNAAVIYVKYGLINKAVGELNAVLALDPRNEEAHLHLKEIYKGNQETARAVKACLALSEIYRLQGDLEKEAGILRQAREISPDDVQVDTRLLELGVLEERKEVPQRPKPARVENIGELWEEADFYAQQGMADEAALSWFS